MTTPTMDRSYRALLAVPSLGRVLLGMAISRIGGGMLSVAAILFTLERYDSPALAGLVSFASVAPGLLVSPIAGALLDRHGRTRLIVLDLVVGSIALLLIATLAVADLLPPWLLVAIMGVASLTSPLSTTGLRSLFPIIVPPHLWERANAVDSNGYVLMTLIGPPAAGALVQFGGGPAAMVAIGVVLAVSAAILAGAPDPETDTASSGSILRDAWLGLLYTWRNRSLRGLGFSISALNLAGGATTIILPLMILDRLGGTEAMVGIAFAVMGITGAVAAFVFGRVDSEGIERPMLALPMLGMAAAVLLLLPGNLILLLIALAAFGFLNGPLDIALFTLRQRRTDPAWMGRAFAVSMAFNYAGVPLGSLTAGLLGTAGIEIVIVLAALCCVVAAAIAWWWIPGQAPAIGISGGERPA
ncbi:MAG TPA: MFS transporter [Candidatus Limnocylindrales bacterium]